MSNKPIRILVVDDHYVVRVGVVAILNLNPQFVVVGEAEDGARALELYRQHQPEITLMDLRMPGTGGVAATRAILEEFPAARIIVLTTYDAEEDIHGALKAGVKGATVRRDLATLSCLCSCAVAWDYIEVNPVKQFSKRHIKEAAPRTTYPTSEQVDRLIANSSPMAGRLIRFLSLRARQESTALSDLLLGRIV